MDNAQKAIMVGVGLFITIIIISAVLLIVNLGTGLVDDATDNLSSISSSLQNQLLAQYDNKQLTGAQVKDAMQKYMTSNEISLVLVGDDAEGNPAITANVGARNYTNSNIKFADDIGFVMSEEYDDSTTSGMVTSMRDFNNQDESTTYISNTGRYVSRIVYLGESSETAITANRVLGVIFIPTGYADAMTDIGG